MTENKDLPAFACATNNFIHKGLTKREYFAAKAMQGILASRELQKAICEDKESWASVAVNQADELLKELDKTNP